MLENGMGRQGGRVGIRIFRDERATEERPGSLEHGGG